MRALHADIASFSSKAAEKEWVVRAQNMYDGVEKIFSRNEMYSRSVATSRLPFSNPFKSWSTFLTAKLAVKQRVGELRQHKSCQRMRRSYCSRMPFICRKNTTRTPLPLGDNYATSFDELAQFLSLGIGCFLLCWNEHFFDT